MQIISKKAFQEFWTRHPESEQSLKAWHGEVNKADWSSPAQLKERYSSASILADNRVVFNIGGNKYRLVVWIRYQQHTVYVKWIGTHAAYNRVDAEKVEV